MTYAKVWYTVIGTTFLFQCLVYDINQLLSLWPDTVFIKFAIWSSINEWQLVVCFIINASYVSTCQHDELQKLLYKISDNEYCKIVHHCFCKDHAINNHVKIYFSCCMWLIRFVFMDNTFYEMWLCIKSFELHQCGHCWQHAMIWLSYFLPDDKISDWWRQECGVCQQYPLPPFHYYEILKLGAFLPC